MTKLQAKKITGYLMVVSVFFIPLWPLIPPILWGLSLLFWFYGNGIPKSIPPILKKSHLLLFISFYVVLAIGMLWSTDFDYGLRDLRIKIPMLLFPLFFGFFIMDAQTEKYFKYAFVCGCMLACVLCFVNAIFNFYQTGNSTSFFYTNYSPFLFPAYFAMNLNLAALIVLDWQFEVQNQYSKKHKIFLGCMAFFFLLNIILLSEKMQLITAFITVPFFLVFEARKRNELKKMLIKISVLACVFIFILWGYINVFNRFSQVTDALNSFKESSSPRPDNYYNSSTIRLAGWKYGFEIFKENLNFGVGTGDIKLETLAKYKANNFEYGIKHFETTASQYLHVGIILGVFGLLFLLANYFVPFYLSLKYKNYLYAGFLLIYILNSIPGTILSASGVMTYGFFNSFLYVLLYKQIKTGEKNTISDLNFY